MNDWSKKHRYVQVIENQRFLIGRAEWLVKETHGSSNPEFEISSQNDFCTTEWKCSHDDNIQSGRGKN